MIERCAVTNVTVPECSCEHCLIALVETHAPQVRPVAEIITLPVRRTDRMVRAAGRDTLYGAR